MCRMHAKSNTVHVDFQERAASKQMISISVQATYGIGLNDIKLVKANKSYICTG